MVSHPFGFARISTFGGNGAITSFDYAYSLFLRIYDCLCCYLGTGYIYTEAGVWITGDSFAFIGSGIGTASQSYDTLR